MFPYNKPGAGYCVKPGEASGKFFSRLFDDDGQMMSVIWRDDVGGTGVSRKKKNIKKLLFKFLSW